MKSNTTNKTLQDLENESVALWKRREDLQHEQERIVREIRTKEEQASALILEDKSADALLASIETARLKLRSLEQAVEAFDGRYRGLQDEIKAARVIRYREAQDDFRPHLLRFVDDLSAVFDKYHLLEGKFEELVGVAQWANVGTDHEAFNTEIYRLMRIQQKYFVLLSRSLEFFGYAAYRKRYPK